MEFQQSITAAASAISRRKAVLFAPMAAEGDKVVIVISDIGRGA